MYLMYLNINCKNIFIFNAYSFRSRNLLISRSIIKKTNLLNNNINNHIMENCVKFVALGESKYDLFIGYSL